MSKGIRGPIRSKHTAAFPPVRADTESLRELSLFELLRIVTVNGVCKARGVKTANPLAPRLPTPVECALRLPQVCTITGLRRSMIYRLQAEKRFPQRIKLSERAVGWLEREVQEWLAERIKSSREGET